LAVLVASNKLEISNLSDISWICSAFMAKTHRLSIGKNYFEV